MCASEFVCVCLHVSMKCALVGEIERDEEITKQKKTHWARMNADKRNDI